MLSLTNLGWYTTRTEEPVYRVSFGTGIERVIDRYSTPTKQPMRYGGREEGEQIHKNEDFSDIAVPLKPRFDELVAQENGELDLDKDYKGNPLMQHVQAMVAAETTEKPLFEPTSEELSSGEIYKKIKDHWDALSNCPWSARIKGTLALLKYSVENGERVRFWLEGFKDHYGFRLRTRDHDWITGNLYISPPNGDTSPKPTIIIHESGGSRWVASLGRMWILVCQQADD